MDNFHMLIFYLFSLTSFFYLLIREERANVERATPIKPGMALLPNGQIICSASESPDGTHIVIVAAPAVVLAAIVDAL